MTVAGHRRLLVCMRRHAALALVGLLAACAAPPPAAPTGSPASFDPAGTWEIRWDRTFAGWKPPIFDGTLELARDGAHWTGSLRFKPSRSRPMLKELRVDGDRLRMVFTTEGAPIEMVAWAHAGNLVGEARWGKIGWTAFGARPRVLPKLSRGAVDHSLPQAPADGVDSAALATLLEHAAEERSSAIVIAQDGKLRVEAYREGYAGAPLMAMSASKSVTALAVGLLIADGKLTLDTRMDALLPDWKQQGDKGAITVRQLLTHTSGLDPARADFARGETIRARALAAKLVFSPGTRFQYNSLAVDLLALVVARAGGKPLDALLDERLFRKLDAVGATWMKDAEGTPRAAGELVIRPVDLAKIGQLMLDGGVWRGERILPAEWVERATAAGQAFNESAGMLWWREGTFAEVLDDTILASFRDVGVPEDALGRARALLGKRFERSEDYRSAVRAALGKAATEQIEAAGRRGDLQAVSHRVAAGPTRGFAARGWLGQTLVVHPAARVVGVRMRAPDEGEEERGGERDAYHAFAADLAKLYR